MDPAGKTAIVTGGNSGLGEASCKSLLAAGAKVISFDLDGAAPDGAEFITCDVTDSISVSLAVARVADKYGDIHILINNAGIGGNGPISGPDGPADMEAFRSVISVNLLGAAQVAAEVSHAMISNAPTGADGERGVIVNSCSIASFGGQEGMGAYAASKAALAALTLVWARDLSGYAIRVNGIAPGLMATPMVAPLPSGFIDELIEGNEFPKRAGTGGEFASAIEFIIRNSLLNGEVIRLDAGARPPARMHWKAA